MKQTLALSAALLTAAASLTACSADAPLSPADLAPLPSAEVAAPRAEAIPGQYIVQLKDGVLDVRSVAAAFAREHGGNVGFVYSNALKGFSVKLPEGIAAQAIAALSRSPLVQRIEQDQVMRVVNSDVETGATWGIDRIDQADRPLSTTYVYNASGVGVTVYIIDTGIRKTHAEIAGRAFTGIDEITSGGTANDCNGHGTHVSGTVGGTTYGVAKDVRLVAVRVLDCNGSGTTSGVVAGVDWVTGDKNAHPSQPSAANMSLGGGASQTLDDAVRRGIAAGVTFALAAGNGDILGNPLNACNSSPARTAEALTVGATNSSDVEASWSNYGTCVDILAPGVSITSSWATSDIATNTISGTSMATPHVAGAAALFLPTNPTATPAEVAAALLGNASVGKITLKAVSVSNGTPNKLLYTGFIFEGPPPPPPAPPAAPSGLTASLAGASSASLAWTDNSDNELTFDVERCSGTDCSDFAKIGTAAANTTTYTDAGLAGASTFNYRVRAVNAGGASDYTNTASVTTPADAPPVAKYSWSCSADGRTCDFDGRASTDDSGVTAWNWNFGDAATATGSTARRRFSRNGTFDVTLTVSDAASQTHAVTCAVTTGKGRTGTCNM